MITCINPWHNPLNNGSKAVLTYATRPMLMYRDVAIYKNPAGSYDYILNGTAITQRAGYHKDRATVLIDEMLSLNDLTMSDTVKAHIAKTLETP